MTPYFIASLPRSRTAWLANFLTYGPSFCFHEPMDQVSIQQYPWLFGSVAQEFVGSSDSANTFVMEQLIDLFPAAKIVVIRRELNAVRESLKQIGLDSGLWLEKMDRLLDRIEYAYRPLVIPYLNFDAGRIWHYLFPHVPLNQRRLEMLENFRLQVPAQVSIQKGYQLLERNGEVLLPLI
jgi:hypothetical protein